MVTPIEGTRASGHTKTDAELLGDIRAANAEALDGLFHRYVRLVTGIARRILNDHAEAEDITQEIFLEIYRKAHLFSAERGSVRVWLLQYVYHRALRRKAALRRRAAYRGEPIDALDQRRPDRAPRLSSEECRWILRTGLAQLPTQQRATLELSCFEDLPLRDVAERLGVSLGCTRHYYYRGLEGLRRWARVTDRRPSLEGRNGGSAGTTGAARGRDRRPHGRP